MPQVEPIYQAEDLGWGKILAVVIVFAFLIFALNIIRLWPYLYQMERAAEETSELISGTGGASVSIIQSEMIPEIRMILIFSLIFFGLLDGIFALMLWKKKLPKNQEIIVILLVMVYAFNRFVSTYVMTVLPTMILIGSNSRTLMNTLYSTIPVFFAVSLIIILLIKTKVLMRKKGTKILFKMPYETSH